MKICLANSLFYPEKRGGAEALCQDMAKKLSQENEVFVLTTGAGPKLKIGYYGKVKVYYLPPRNLFWYRDIGHYPFAARALWHLGDMFNFFNFWQIKKILRQEKPDLIIAHNLKGLGYLAARAFLADAAPYYQVMHDVQLVVPSGIMLYQKNKPSFLARQLTKAYSCITKKIFSSPQKVIFPSCWLRDFYSQRGFFPFSLKQHLPHYNVSPLRLKIKREKIFLYVGQLEEHKGILFLLRVWQWLAPTDWRLFVVGAGSCEKEVKQLARQSQNVEVLGYLDRKEIFSLYQKSFAVIVPSFCYENSPLVVKEALENGAFVLAPRLGGAGELVEEGKNGLLFAPADEKDLIEKIKQAQKKYAPDFWAPLQKISEEEYYQRLLAKD